MMDISIVPETASQVPAILSCGLPQDIVSTESVVIHKTNISHLVDFMSLVFMMGLLI